MSKFVWVLVVALIVLHQDNWFWSDTRLVFGFVPVALLYHMGISTGAAITWFLATKFCWPLDDARPAASQGTPGGEA
ncbi:MAG: hypothetical protein CMJ58_17535 [Planctomycetaceae bacterium]|nr:hypothetical protein [Planctomycetaceae bacterium]